MTKKQQGTMFDKAQKASKHIKSLKVRPLKFSKKRKKINIKQIISPTLPTHANSFILLFCRITRKTPRRNFANENEPDVIIYVTPGFCGCRVCCFCAVGFLLFPDVLIKEQSKWFWGLDF